jgi:hypothetical protein
VSEEEGAKGWNGKRGGEPVGYAPPIQRKAASELKSYDDDTSFPSVRYRVWKLSRLKWEGRVIVAKPAAAVVENRGEESSSTVKLNGIVAPRETHDMTIDDPRPYAGLKLGRAPAAGFAIVKSTVG